MIRSLRYSFTAEQTSAITHPARVLLVYGGPNSGKTTVIAGRIAHHITESTCRPDQVLAFMPSSRTASALQSTIGNIFGNSSIHRDCNIQTYHSLAIDILKSYRAEAGLSETFRVLSPAEEAVFLHNRIKEIQAPEKYRLPRAHSSLIRLFSTIHKERISIERLRLSSPDIASMFCSFQNLKSEASVLTYDDVIDRVIELMLNEKAISEIISSSYCSIFIDSLQEMNNALLQFLGQIIKPSTAQITATVDPNRFVKSYYYGSTDPIASFRRLFPVTDQAYLTSSFTCPKQITYAAEQLIGNNRLSINNLGKVFSGQPDSEGSIGSVLSSSLDESVRAITRFINDGIKNYNWTYTDICILSRNLSDTRDVSRLLRENDIPVHVNGASLDEANREVRLLISYLVASTQPSNIKALFNVIASYSFQPIEISSLFEACDLTSPSCQSLMWERLRNPVCTASDDEQRFRDQCKELLKTIDSIREIAASSSIWKLSRLVANRLSLESCHLDVFLNRASMVVSGLGSDHALFVIPYLHKVLSHDRQFWDEVSSPFFASPPSVTTSTIQKARYLRFPVVVLNIPPDRLLPGIYRRRAPVLPDDVLNAMSDDPNAAWIETQRRLVYTAMTRSTDTFLFASSTSSPVTMSRFIDEALGAFAPGCGHPSAFPDQ